MEKDTLAPVVFLTAVCSAADKTDARLMIQSLRDFGGAYSRAPFWLFDYDEEVNTTNWEALRVERYRGELAHDLKGHLFAQKVSACAQAEAMTDGHTYSLVWIDPCCLIVRPPALFDLDDAADAAFRPVHIRNVGLPREDPVNPFWRRIFTEIGVEDLPGEITSFVDRQRLRPYFNSHGFSINPQLHLMKRWKALFTNLCRDETFQKGACAAKREQIFLFQALLSALVVSSIPPERLRMLPPDYNYPYNLQDSIDGEHRAATFNSLTMFTYEELPVNPAKIHNIAVEEPLLSWLKKHAA